MVPLWMSLIGYGSAAAVIIILTYCGGIYILDIRRDKKVREKIFGLLTEYLTEREANEFMVNNVGVDWKIRPGIYWKEKMQAFLGYKDQKEPIEGVVVKVLQIMKAIMGASKPEREATEKEYEHIKAGEEIIRGETG